MILFYLLILLVFNLQQLVLLCVLYLVGVCVFVELYQFVDEFTFSYLVKIWHKDLFLPVAHVYDLFDIPLFLHLVAVHGQVQY